MKPTSNTSQPYIVFIFCTPKTYVDRVDRVEGFVIGCGISMSSGGSRAYKQNLKRDDRRRGGRKCSSAAPSSEVMALFTLGVRSRMLHWRVEWGRVWA